MVYIATVKILIDEAENAYPGCRVLGTEGGDHE
jgi:hypothetical protein